MKISININALVAQRIIEAVLPAAVARSNAAALFNKAITINVGASTIERKSRCYAIVGEEDDVNYQLGLTDTVVLSEKFCLAHGMPVGTRGVP